LISRARNVAAALATVGLALAASAEDTVEQQIRELDAKEAAAMLAADLAGLDRLWSADFVVNAPDNEVKAKAQVLAAVREGRIAYSAFDREVERVVVHGDVAVSMGGETVVPKGDRPDAGKPLARRYSHVWRRIGGAWSLIARHANLAPAPPG
jgi:ketosteroid isomerase-like protein